MWWNSSIWAVRLKWQLKKFLIYKNWLKIFQKNRFSRWSLGLGARGNFFNHRSPDRTSREQITGVPLQIGAISGRCIWRFVLGIFLRCCCWYFCGWFGAASAWEENFFLFKKFSKIFLAYENSKIPPPMPLLVVLSFVVADDLENNGILFKKYIYI